MVLSVSTHDHMGIVENGGMIGSAPENVEYCTLLYNGYQWEKLCPSHMVQVNTEMHCRLHTTWYQQILHWHMHACTVEQTCIDQTKTQYFAAFPALLISTGVLLPRLISQ